jgi:hypothetical protein
MGVVVGRIDGMDGPNAEHWHGSVAVLLTAVSGAEPQLQTVSGLSDFQIAATQRANRPSVAGPVAVLGPNVVRCFEAVTIVVGNERRVVV